MASPPIFNLEPRLITQVGLNTLYMGIIFTPILVLVAGTGIYFYSKRDKHSARAQAFMNRYEALLRLLTYRRNARIVKMRSNSLSVSLKLDRDLHHLSLAEVDDRLIIVWKLESPLMGKHGKEWSFNPNYSQNRMYQEVLTDIRNYQEMVRNDKGILTRNDFTTA